MHVCEINEGMSLKVETYCVWWCSKRLLLEHTEWICDRGGPNTEIKEPKEEE